MTAGPEAEEVQAIGRTVRERPTGLFVGLCTLDIIQLVDHVPAADEKLTAHDQAVAAGGPATGAAAAFSHLGGAATLLTAIGDHPLSSGIKADLSGLGVRVIDLAAGMSGTPAVSSILVTAATGQRAVASVNAARHRLRAPEDLDALLEDAGIVELDGHHRELALAVAEAARRRGRLTVFDGGSWKEGTGELLSSIDIAVCSADFRPPGTGSAEDVLAYLLGKGVHWAAVSRGGAPILWAGSDGAHGEVRVPETAVVDTLGAGDVLHGALTYHLAGRGVPDRARFVGALEAAAQVASRACASFGPRSWMTVPPAGTRTDPSGAQ